MTIKISIARAALITILASGSALALAPAAEAGGFYGFRHGGFHGGFHGGRGWGGHRWGGYRYSRFNDGRGFGWRGRYGYHHRHL